VSRARPRARPGDETSARSRRTTAGARTRTTWGEMVGVGIFLLIAFQFFVLAFVDFPFQAR
jgi:hypothetical protein